MKNFHLKVFILDLSSLLPFFSRKQGSRNCNFCSPIVWILLQKSYLLQSILVIHLHELWHSFRMSYHGTMFFALFHGKFDVFYAICEIWPSSLHGCDSKFSLGSGCTIYCWALSAYGIKLWFFPCCVYWILRISFVHYL